MTNKATVMPLLMAFVERLRITERRLSMDERHAIALLIERAAALEQSEPSESPPAPALTSLPTYGDIARLLPEGYAGFSEEYRSELRNNAVRDLIFAREALRNGGA